MRASGDETGIRIEIVFATRDKQVLLSAVVPEGFTAAEAISESALSKFNVRRTWRCGAVLQDMALPVAICCPNRNFVRFSQGDRIARILRQLKCG